LSAERLLVQIDAMDAGPLGGETVFEIQHSTPADELGDLDETLRLILRDVGAYVSEVG
jgi:hypothetical protein